MIALLIFCACLAMNCKENDPTGEAKDLYDYPVQYIHIKGKTDWINQVELRKYKRNGNFDTLVSTEKIKLEGYKYDPESDRTLAFFPELDYHYDFILEFRGDSVVSTHKFSDFLIKEFETSQYTYTQIVKYKYNSKWYADGQCNFYLDPDQ